eukprot:9449758-Pyramimonas_sp.AAC.1
MAAARGGAAAADGSAAAANDGSHRPRGRTDGSRGVHGRMHFQHQYQYTICKLCRYRSTWKWKSE